MLVKVRVREDLLQRAMEEILSGPLGLLRRCGFNGTPEGRRRWGWVHEEAEAWYVGAGGDANVWKALCIPRDHGKTTIGCGTVVWRKLWDPNHRLFTGAADMTLGALMVGQQRAICGGKVQLDDGSHVWFADLFDWMEPATRARSGACEEFNVVGRTGGGAEPCFFARSPQTGFSGMHPTGGHLDDLTTEKGSKSPTVRLESVDFARRIRPIMFGGLRAPLTAAYTPWHFWDAGAHYENSPEWRVLKYGVLDAKGEDQTLCPSFLNWEEWCSIRDDTTKDPDFVSAQYHCKPRAVANALFTEELVDHATRRDWEYERILAQPGGVLALWDPTSRTEARAFKGDANGLVILKPIVNEIVKVKDVEPKRNIWFLIHAHQEQGGADAMLQWIEREMTEQHDNVFSIGIEEAFLQSYVAPWATMKASKELPFASVPVGKAQRDYRLMAIATAMRRGLVCLAPRFPGRSLITRQLTEYPKSDRDDVPSALALLSAFFYRRGRIDAPPKKHVDRALHTRPRARHHGASDAWTQ